MLFALSLALTTFWIFSVVNARPILSHSFRFPGLEQDPRVYQWRAEEHLRNMHKPQAKEERDAGKGASEEAITNTFKLAGLVYDAYKQDDDHNVKINALGRVAQTAASAAIGGAIVYPFIGATANSPIQQSLIYGAISGVYAGITHLAIEPLARLSQKQFSNTPLLDKRKSVGPLRAAMDTIIPTTALIHHTVRDVDPPLFVSAVATQAGAAALASVPIRLASNALVKALEKTEKKETIDKPIIQSSTK